MITVRNTCPICNGQVELVNRKDIIIGKYPQLYCGQCQLAFEFKSNISNMFNDAAYNYLRDALLSRWNRRRHNGTVKDFV
jgi:uncharacterized protein YbaR (Trm112 family)